MDTNALSPVIEESGFISLNNHNVKQLPPVLADNVGHSSVAIIGSEITESAAGYEGDNLQDQEKHVQQWDFKYFKVQAHLKGIIPLWSSKNKKSADTSNG